MRVCRVNLVISQNDTAILKLEFYFRKIQGFFKKPMAMFRNF